MRAVRTGAVVVLMTVPAFAHVGVTPRESHPGATETYALRVPSEGGRTTISVTLEVPEGVTVLAVAEAEGASHTEVRDGGRIVRVDWSVEIAPGAAAVLSFDARNPAGGTAITWKVRQGYADGSVSDWTGEPGSPTPAAVTALGPAGEHAH